MTRCAGCTLGRRLLPCWARSTAGCAAEPVRGWGTEAAQRHCWAQRSRQRGTWQAPEAAGQALHLGTCSLHLCGQLASHHRQSQASRRDICVQRPFWDEPSRARTLSLDWTPPRWGQRAGDVCPCGCRPPRCTTGWCSTRSSSAWAAACGWLSPAQPPWPPMCAAPCGLQPPHPVVLVSYLAGVQRGQAAPGRPRAADRLWCSPPWTPRGHPPVSIQIPDPDLHRLMVLELTSA